MARAMATTSSNDANTAFPLYPDGDVLIVLSTSRRYQLHSNTLRLHSDLFQNLLTADKAANLTTKILKKGTTMRYRFDLTIDEEEKESSTGRFILKHVDERGCTQDAIANNDYETGSFARPVYKDYDNLFRAYYYQPVSLNDTNIADVLHDIAGLTNVAEYLGSMRVVSLCIGNALIKQGQFLYRSVAANATAWAELAFRVRSEIIFREAIIHLVGQWVVLSHDKEIMATMRKEILELCQHKHTQLDDKKRAIELRIMGHYPTHIQKINPGVTGPGSKTLRGSGNHANVDKYGADVLSWMALNLFRHWLGQHVCGDLNRHAPDGGYVFYHAIAAAGERYIDYAAIEGFTRVFPLSKKARNMFENQLATLKEGVRPFVDHLVDHKSMLDITKWPVKYLTCTEVVKTDLPWECNEDKLGAMDHVRAVRTMLEKKRKSGSAGSCSSRAERAASIFVADDDLDEEEAEDDRDHPGLSTALKRTKLTAPEANSCNFGDTASGYIKMTPAGVLEDQDAEGEPDDTGGAEDGNMSEEYGE